MYHYYYDSPPADREAGPAAVPPPETPPPQAGGTPAAPSGPDRRRPSERGAVAVLLFLCLLLGGTALLLFFHSRPRAVTVYMPQEPSSSATAPMAAAGGLEDGSFGTSFERIEAAIRSVYSEDGVVILMDLGSAVMTTEMVLESMDGQKAAMADCPLVEGAVVAAIESAGGVGFEELLEHLGKVGETKKF